MIRREGKNVFCFFEGKKRRCEKEKKNYEGLLLFKEKILYFFGLNFGILNVFRAPNFGIPDSNY